MSIGDVLASPKGRRIVPSFAIDSAAHWEKKKCWRKTVGADVDHGQPGPVQGLLAQPVHPLLERVGHRQEAHLRDGQLGDVDEHLQAPQLAGDRGGGDGRLQVGRGHAHAEIHPTAAVEGPRDVLGPGEVAHDDLGPRRPERLGPVVIRPHQGPDRQALAAEDVDHLSAHPSDTACGAGDEDR